MKLSLTIPIKEIEGWVTFSIHDAMAAPPGSPADREDSFPLLFIEPLHPEYASLAGLDIGHRPDRISRATSPDHIRPPLRWGSVHLLWQITLQHRSNAGSLR